MSRSIHAPAMFAPAGDPLPVVITRQGMIARLRHCAKRARSMEQDRFIAALLDLQEAGTLTEAQVEAICAAVEARR